MHSSTRAMWTGAMLLFTALATSSCGGGGGSPNPGGPVIGCYYNACIPTSAPSGTVTSTPTPLQSGITPTPLPSGVTPTPTMGTTATPIASSTTTPSGQMTATPIGGMTATPTATPVSNMTATPTATSTPGAISLNPTLLIPVGVTNPASATTVVTQTNYNGPFTASVSCPGSGVPTGTLTVNVSGNDITVDENPNLVAALGSDIDCTLTVTGGGGMTATATVLLATSVLPPTSPTPSPGPSSTPGPVSVEPGLLIPVGITNPAVASATISEFDYAGPFTASVSCPAGVATGSVNATVNGDLVVVTVADGANTQGALGANLACTLTVTGYNNMTGSSTILIAANVGA